MTNQIAYLSVAFIGGIAVKVIVDWIKPSKNRNGYYMPRECREKMEEHVKEGIESVLILRDIKEILKENQRVLIHIQQNGKR
ncbi:MAG TPA: hypothetical protein ENH87_11210 [Pricia antarctica]|uniref:Uncharacterized protein n=2 Tax=root TaxID=1 RepID=A0A831QQJ0_9FLAO|nr:hypothetical protein [Pricia antarctica]